MKEKYQNISKDGGYESGYESDDGNLYKVAEPLGEGVYCEARKMVAINNPAKFKVSIKPLLEYFTNGIDFEEAQTKRDFFKAMYPEQTTYYTTHYRTDSYRLVVPYVPGEKLNQLAKKVNAKQLIKLFMATVDALMLSHQRNYICIDLKEDCVICNEVIHNNKSTYRCQLVDGGLSSKRGDKVKKQFIETLYCPHVAPECKMSKEAWEKGENKATDTMDIYSFGSMMSRMWRESGLSRNEELFKLARACLAYKPQNRPSLLYIKKVLYLIQINFQEHLYKLIQQISGLSQFHNRHWLILGSFTMALCEDLIKARDYYLKSTQSFDEAKQQFKLNCLKLISQYYRDRKTVLPSNFFTSMPKPELVGNNHHLRIP